MTAKRRIPITEARRFAEEFVELIEPYCERVVIAGSIRRNAHTVGDIEILAEPKIEQLQLSMFDDGESGVRDLLDTHIQELILRPGLNYLRPRRVGTPERVVMGDRTKYLLWKGFPLDLFAVKPPSQWGAQLVIRTGPAIFNHLLMTPRFKGGAMPPGMTHHEGALWTGDPKRGRPGRLIPTATEEEWFKAIGVPYWEPELRTEERLRRWLKKQP